MQRSKFYSCTGFVSKKSTLILIKNQTYQPRYLGAFTALIIGVLKLTLNKTGPFPQESNWEGQIKGDWEKTILPYAQKLGAKSIGALGELPITCLTNKNTNIG
jgi:hypothetical protein